jgi:hypothetical protein
VIGLAIKTYAVPMADYPQDIKLVLCLTDDACNDAELGREIRRVMSLACSAPNCVFTFNLVVFSP